MGRHCGSAIGVVRGAPLLCPSAHLPICLAALTALSACTPAPPALLKVERSTVAGATRLTLAAAPGARINALLTPVLERDGEVLRFTGGRVTADSSYYTDPPSLELDKSIRGEVRASVCPQHRGICVPVRVRL
jgi:hypothetical protein